MATANTNYLIKILLESDPKGAKAALASLEKIKNISKKINDMSNSLMLKVTAPLSLIGGTMMKVAGEFEASMQKLKAVSGATETEFLKLQKTARALGATTKYSATEAGEAMNFLAMAGFKSNEIIGAVPHTLKLATASGLDLATSADIVSNILTGFNGKVEDLANANDVLVAAMTSSNVDLRMLGETMKYAAPIASATGQSLSDVAAAAGVLGNAGIQGSMAGTTLRSALITLAGASDKQIQKFESLGVKIKDSTGKMLPFKDIIQSLSTSGISAGEVFEIFGDRAASGITALISQNGELQNLSNNLQNVNGKADEVAKTMQKGFFARLTELKSAWEELSIELANSGLIEVFSDLIEGAKSAIAYFSSLSSQTKKMIVNIGLFAAALGPALKVVALITGDIGKAIFAFKAFRKGVTSATVKLKAWNASMIASSKGITSMGGKILSCTGRLGVLGLKAAAVGAVLVASFQAGAWAGEKLNKVLVGIKFDSVIEGMDRFAKGQKKIVETDISKALNSKSVKELEENFNALNWQISIQKNHLEDFKRLLKEGGISKELEENYEQSIKNTTAHIEALENALLEKDNVAKQIYEEEKRRAKEENNRKLTLSGILAQIARGEKESAREKMSFADKHNSILEEEKSLKEDLNKIKSDIKNEVLSLDVRIGLAQQYSSIENQLNQTISNRQQIEKELLSLQNEKLKKKNEEIELERQKTSFSLEWELMEAQAKGDESQIKATNEKIALNEVMNNLRQKGLFTEKEIAKKAKEYISLQKQIENNEKRKDEKTKKNAYEDFQNELKIKKLRAEGKNELADSLEIQKKAKELAKEWAIPYQDALDDLKELNKLENSRNQKKDKNSDPKNVKFGRTIKQLETEQTKIQKDLGSDNRYTVQKAKQRQKAYEDKYGINLNDDVRSYEGRDRKTGRLVNAKVGKEYEENQAYKQAKQRAFDMAKINKNKNNAQTPQVSTNLAQQTPQIPISQAQQSPATPAKNQNSQANQNTDQKSPNSNSQDSKLLQSMTNYLKELVSTQKQIKKKLADLENIVGKVATN